MSTAESDLNGPVARHRERDGPFAVLRDDLQRSRIVCNTLDALFRRREGLCPVLEALSFRDFVASDLHRIYETWSVDIIPLIEGAGKADPEAQSLVVTLRSELLTLRTMATGLAAALDVYCAHPTEAAKRSIAEHITRFCPSHRNLTDWLQAPVLSWLARHLHASLLQSLAEKVACRQDAGSDPNLELRRDP